MSTSLLKRKHHFSGSGLILIIANSSATAKQTTDSFSKNHLSESDRVFASHTRPCLYCSQRSYFPRSHNGWSNSENSRPFQPKVPKSFHCVPQSNIVRSVTVIFHKPGVAALEGNPQTSIWGRRWHQHHSREANPCWHDNPLTARFSERNRHRQGPWIWLISSQTCWNLLHTLWKCTQPSKAEIK